MPVPAAIEIALPPLPPEEAEEQPRELVDAPAAPAVPQLADVPTSVALSDFAQALDLRPRAEVDVGALKSMTIPVSRGRGGAGPGPAGAIFNLSQLDRVPQPVAQPSPSFPKGVRIAGLEQAVVVVEFIVDAEGRVLEPRVTHSNAPEFDRAALAGVARWKFRPGILSGRKVATRMEVPLKFDLTARE
ncbi:energy transducer TonB [Oleiharenicola sp. Vm1]|uniref:energy transducer TonB n=1 Tax=Oleiharenicola sp. Vm1 TaxID=3398393 RepID=UPI0039F607C6